MNQGTAARASAFQFKGSLLPFTTMELATADPVRIAGELPSVVAQAPGFFEQAPVILGVEKVASAGLDLEALCALLRAERLLPVGVRGGGDDVRASSHALGLAWFPAESAQKRPAVARRQESADTPPAPVGRTHRGTVRSGQQIAALSGDLIIVGAVNPGAEVLAAGNVHVYGALRGRALAGIHGDAESGIFCRALEAELVSVAGNYKRREDIDPERIGRAAEIRWLDEQLRVLALD